MLFLRRFKLRILFVFGVLILLPFQQCSQATFSSAPSSSKLMFNMGGQGFDGLKYQSYGTCSGQIGVVSEIGLSADGTSGLLLRQNCQDLNPPIAIAKGDLQFSAADPGVLNYQSRAYDVENMGPSQVTTVQFCSTSDGSANLRIWALASAPTSYLGSVDAGSSTLTGSLTLQSNLNGYASMAGQQNSLSAQFSGGQANVTYALGGGAPVDLTMTCATQSPPPDPPYASMTINGQSGTVTVKVGAAADFVWVSAGAVSATATYHVSSGPNLCGDPTSPAPWIDVNTLSGSANSSAGACQAGSTYTLIYAVTSASGQTTTLTTYFIVSP